MMRTSTTRYTRKGPRCLACDCLLTRPTLLCSRCATPSPDDVSGPWARERQERRERRRKELEGLPQDTEDTDASGA